MAAIMKFSRPGAVLLLAAGLAAGLASCGQTPAAGGLAPQPTPAATGANQSGTAAAGTAVTVTAIPGEGSATAGTGSAGPAITVSGPVTVGTGGPLPTAPPSLTGPVTLTGADSGAVVNLRVGQQVTVVLAPAFMAWHVPSATGAVLRRVSASGGYPGRQPARAVFLAVAPGTAVLSAESDTACLHAHPRCMVPQQLWQATIRVSGG